MTGLLLITAIWVPFMIAFLDDNLGIFVDIFNYFIDFFFAADIVITFLQSYEHVNGREECQLKKIALNYFSGWFFFDLTASIPPQLFESSNSSESTRLTKLSRLPRLYRLTKILRLIKLLRTLKYNKQVSKIVKTLNLTSGRTRVLKSVLVSMLLVHLISCFWFM